jgi:hypothetical protein
MPLDIHDRETARRASRRVASRRKFKDHDDGEDEQEAG